MGKCTVCNIGEIVEKKGPYGVFYSCNKYPECKTVYNKDEDGNFTVKVKKQIKTTGRKCPDCEKAGRDGELVERSNKSSGDKFFGCSKYPTCKYSEQLDGTVSKKKDYKKFSKGASEDDAKGNECNAESTNDDDLNLDV
jgi:ssDNA-binding Zn-finger/Zn-ribbon topoisomerase 1